MTPIHRQHAQLSGRGERVLVFAHGFGTDQRAWRFVAPAFEQDHRVLCFDHVGSGQSRLSAYGDQRHATLEGHAADLVDLLRSLRLPPVVLVGHSVGGAIGLLASLAAPALFERLVLVGTSPHFLNTADGYRGGFEAHEIEDLLDLMEADRLAWADALAPMAMGDDSPGELVSEFGGTLRALDPLVARRFGRLAFGVDLRAHLAQVRVPALVMQCAHDSIVPREVGRWMHRQLAASRYVELPASGHCPHLSHPALVVQALRDELAQPPATPA